MININTREVISTISFDHLYNNQIVEDILSAMVSTLMLSRSSYNGDINVLTQCMTDEKTAFFQVKFQSTIPLEDTGKSLSEALIFAEHGENMLCTEIVLNVKNNFCTQHVLPMFLGFSYIELLIQ